MTALKPARIVSRSPVFPPTVKGWEIAKTTYRIARMKADTRRSLQSCLSNSERTYELGGRPDCSARGELAGVVISLGTVIRTQNARPMPEQGGSVSGEIENGSARRTTKGKQSWRRG